MALGDLTSIESVSTEEHTRTSTERVGDEYRFGTTAREVITVAETGAITMKPDRLCLHLVVATGQTATVTLPPAHQCTGRVAVLSVSGAGTLTVASPSVSLTVATTATGAFISNGAEWVQITLT